MADQANSLHIALFPWLAFGHMIPFLQFSISLAQRNHRVSFISTPKNIQKLLKLPNLPSNLSSLITLVPLPFPLIENLPPNAESISDTTPDQSQYILQAFDALQDPLTKFLEECSLDWMIYDFSAYWLPPIATKLQIPCIYFNIFNASMTAFYGSVFEMKREDGGSRILPSDFTVPPTWIPFPSNLCLRSYEAPKNKRIFFNKSTVYRLGCAIQGCKFMAVRSCTDFEGDYFKFLENDLYKKPIIPVGLLPPHPPPTIQDQPMIQDQNWEEMKDWLDKQGEKSVLYIAFGSESTLSHDQVTELAHGLEMSKLPFFWVVRKPVGVDDRDSIFPLGFEERVKNIAYITLEWVPQLNILAHRSIGGFLSHGGWNSIVEGLAYGLTMILLPLSPPQGLNARVLEWKRIGLEIPRNEQDGMFVRDFIAESLRTAMVGEEGEELRANARDMMRTFGNEERQKIYMDEFDVYLRKYTCG